MQDIYSYTQIPNESKMFTVSDIQRICGASPSIIRGIAERAGVESFVKKDGRGTVVFDFRSMKQIVAIYKNYSRVDEIIAKNQSKVEKTIEQLRAEHPLVKDDRFFKLSYFPDVTPKCFEVDYD